MSNIINFNDVINKKQKRKKNKFYMYAFFMVFCMCIVIFMTSSFFSIQKLVVTGNKQYSTNDIKEILNIKRNNNIFYLLLSKPDRKLERCPKIRSAYLIYSFPNTVYVNLKENRSIGYIDGGNTSIFIDKNGIVLDISDKKIDNLPLVKGLCDKNNILQYKKGDVISTNEDIIAKVKIIEKLFNVLLKYKLDLNKLIININDVNNIHLNINDIDVNIGKIDDYDKKIMRIKDILDKYISNNDRGYINAIHPDEGIVFTPLQ